MYKLYYAPGTCALASHIALEEAGADYEAVRLDFKANQQQSPDFLKLSTGVAGEVFQKFVNYGLGCAIVGDITRALENSGALRDFVRETNKGKSIWFVADFAELEGRFGTSPAVRASP